jgi:hypothetical protein
MLLAVMPPSDGLGRNCGGAAAGLVSVLDSEPLGKPFPVGMATVAAVVQMTQFVEQNVVQVIVSDCLLGPD